MLPVQFRLPFASYAWEKRPVGGDRCTHDAAELAFPGTEDCTHDLVRFAITAWVTELGYIYLLVGPAQVLESSLHSGGRR